MQKAYLMALYDLAKQNSNVLSLLADSGTGYDELFKQEFPNQLLDFGIAEEHMVSAAAGMATCGKIPFVYTAGAFLAYRCLEFIRDDICFQNLNVKIIGMGSGLAWSTLGPSHHTTEDISILRALPNLTIFSPSCPREVEKVVKAAYEINGPVYIRLGMSNEPDVYEKDYDFDIGKNYVLRQGENVVIFVTGSITSQAMLAVDILKENGTKATLINVPTIKPFDDVSVMHLTGRYSQIIVVEEHNIYGGLGSIISEIVAKNGMGIKVSRIGLEDCFARGYGTIEEVRKQNGLDAESIAKKIIRI